MKNTDVINSQNKKLFSHHLRFHVYCTWPKKKKKKLKVQLKIQNEFGQIWVNQPL